MREEKTVIETKTKTDTEENEQIEFLTSGQQAIFHGQHKDSPGHYYSPDPSAPIADAPPELINLWQNSLKKGGKGRNDSDGWHHKNDILSYISLLTPDNGSCSGSEKSFYCPVCNAKNFKINTETGRYKTFTCNCSSDPSTFWKTLKGLKQPDKKPSVFKLLMEIAEKCDLWHSDDDVAYADVEIDGVRHTYPIRRKAFKTWLSSELYKRHEIGANSEAMTSCLNVLEAKANFEGQERKVFLRTGQDNDGNIYIDLANQAWEVVKVTPAGYEVKQSKDCPIRFSRNEGQLPLPIPKRSGDLSKLWDVIAIAPTYRPLVVAWLAFSLVPYGSKPILTPHGAKGSGKSWSTRVMKSIIDPGKAALLPAVGDRRSLAVAAANRWVLSYDNQTALSIDQQDALCCAATGAGFSHRKLHTDTDEIFIEYTRPQILNSVDLVPTRSDLLDRCLLIKLDRIPDHERKTEAELKETLAALSPGLLGALLDVVAVTLGVSGNQFNQGDKLPRLADFGLFAMKAETALGLEPGGFMKLYQSNIETAQEEAIEANPIAAAILVLMEQQTRFDGTGSELVYKLKKVSEDAKVQKLSARTLGKTLSGSLKQDLEAVGVDCDSYRTAKGRFWLLSLAADKQTKQTSQTSPPTLEPSQGNSFSGDMNSDITMTFSDIKTANVTQTSSNVTPNVINKTQPQQGLQLLSDSNDVYDIKNEQLSSVPDYLRGYLVPGADLILKTDQSEVNFVCHTEYGFAKVRTKTNKIVDVSLSDLDIAPAF